MREARDLLARIRALRRSGSPAVVATIAAVAGSAYRREGTRLLIERDGALTGVLSGGCVERELLAPARGVLADGRPRTLRFDLSADEEAIWGFGLGCSGVLTLLLEPLADAGGALEPALAAALEERREVVIVTRVTPAGGDGGRVTVERTVSAGEPGDGGGATGRELAGAIELVERLAPPIHLVVVGAERDVVPLLRLATELGWQTTVVDPRPTAEAEARVAPLARYLGVAPRRLADEVAFDARTAVLVATHRYLDDLAYLGELDTAPLGYLGLLGPARRRQRLLADLDRRRGGGSAATALVVRGPAGLDLGGRSPHEVALAVTAEIQARFHGADARPLADKAERAERETAGSRE